MAALDLGSNSAHLLVAEVLPGGHIRREATRKVKLRLAEPIVRQGRFGEEVRGRVLAAASDLVAHARKCGAGSLAVVATDALRHAEDGHELRTALVAEVGAEVRVLAGLEEAALAFRGMAAALRNDAPLIGFDLGGGSLEIAYGRAGRFVSGASLPLGAARVATRFDHDPPWLAERSTLHAEARAQVQDVAREIIGTYGDGSRMPPAAGTAGTIRDLGRLGLATAAGIEPERVRGMVVTRAQLEVALARLLTVPAPERLNLPGVSGSRIDILPAGGIVLLAAMDVLGMEQLQLCDWGLREGVVLDALSDQSIVSLADFGPM